MIFFYLLIIMMPFRNFPLFVKLGISGDLTGIKYLGTLCFLYALVYLIARQAPIKLFQTSQARWFVVFALMAMVSFLSVGPNWPPLRSPFSSYLAFLFLFVTTMLLVDSISRLRNVLLAVIGAVALTALYVLREWQHNPFSDTRPGWVAGDPNYFTVSALLCLPLTFYLLQEERPRREKIFLSGCLVITLLAVTLGASRGGFLGLVAASLFVVWHSRQRLWNIFLISALVIPLGILAPQSPLKRFFDPDKSDMQSKAARVWIWRAGLNLAWDNPLIGVGVGNFPKEAWALIREYDPSELSVTPEGFIYFDAWSDPQGQEPSDMSWAYKAYVAHNTYLELAVELGIPGLLLFLAILFGSFRTLAQVRQKTMGSGPALVHQAAIGIQGGLVGYAVAAFFVSAQYQKLFWLMIFLTMCLPLLAGDARKRGRFEVLRVSSPKQPKLVPTG